MPRIDDIADTFDERTILVQMLQYTQETAVMRSATCQRTPRGTRAVFAEVDLGMVRELADGTTGD